MPIPPYDERGSGPVVLLSHGTMMDRTMFADQLAGLGDALPRRRLRPLGARTELSVGPYTLDDLADDCVELLDSLDAERCVLGGMSMGGFMALRFALRHQAPAGRPRPDRHPGVGAGLAARGALRQPRRRRRPPRGGRRVARGHRLRRDDEARAPGARHALEGALAGPDRRRGLLGVALVAPARGRLAAARRGRRRRRSSSTARRTGSCRWSRARRRWRDEVRHGRIVRIPAPATPRTPSSRPCERRSACVSRVRVRDRHREAPPEP